MAHRSQLGTRAPKPYDAGCLLILILRDQLARDEDGQVAVHIVAQPKLANAKDWINGWMDAHLIFVIIGRSLRQARELLLKLSQELLQAYGQGLDLDLLDDHRDRPFGLPALYVKNALTWLADGVGGNMRNRAEVKFGRGHKCSGQSK
jgi:hypothetical protein